MRCHVLFLVCLFSEANAVTVPTGYPGFNVLGGGHVHYTLFAPTKQEWKDTFGAETVSGIAHVWIRCLGETLRGLIVMEDTDLAFVDRPLISALESHENKTTLLARFPRLHLDGAPPVGDDAAWFVADFVGAFFEGSLPSSAIARGVVHVSLHGWVAQAEMPLRHCGLTPLPVQTARARVVSVCVPDGNELGVRFLAKIVLRHAAHARYALNATTYELIVDESNAAALVALQDVAAEMVAGRLEMLVKPFAPALRHSIYWQTVYQNVALLARWHEDAMVFFIGLDEYLVQGRGGVQLDMALTSANLVHVQTAEFVCTSCSTVNKLCLRPDALYPFKGNTWVRA